MFKIPPKVRSECWQIPSHYLKGIPASSKQLMNASGFSPRICKLPTLAILLISEFISNNSELLHCLIMDAIFQATLANRARFSTSNETLREQQLLAQLHKERQKNETLLAEYLQPLENILKNGQLTLTQASELSLATRYFSLKTASDKYHLLEHLLKQLHGAYSLCSLEFKKNNHEHYYKKTVKLLFFIKADWSNATPDRLYTDFKNATLYAEQALKCCPLPANPSPRHYEPPIAMPIDPDSAIRLPIADASFTRR